MTKSRYRGVNLLCSVEVSVLLIMICYWLDMYSADPFSLWINSYSASLCAYFVRTGAGGTSHHRGEDQIFQFFIYFLLWGRENVYSVLKRILQIETNSTLQAVKQWSSWWTSEETVFLWSYRDFCYILLQAFFPVYICFIVGFNFIIYLI